MDGYDPSKKHYLLQGFKHGFRVGYTGTPECKIYPNHKSALENPGVIDEYLAREVCEGRMKGPFSSVPQNFHCSPLALVPKKLPGSFRVIHNLSFPKGNSINDFIPEEFTSVKYQSVYDAIQMLCKLGKIAFMSKTDIEKAFRIIPIHESDQHLFFVNWKGNFYVDLRMEMGCSSSCQIFEAFSTAIAWVAQHKLRIPTVHYLDDFMFGAASQVVGSRNLYKFMQVCKEIGIPLALDKTFQPATTMSFLGFEIDTVKKEIRLPADKLERCKIEILDLIGKKKTRLRKLQSVIGLLNFACEVVLPGRAFLRRLINLTCGVSSPFHWIRLSKTTSGVQEDLQVWLAFLSSYNGKSFFLSERFFSNVSLKLFTDSSASIGYGGYFCNDVFEKVPWFAGTWSEWWRQQNIMFLELYPIVIAIEIWGQVLENKRLLIYTDNKALVPVINKQTSKHALAMILIRRLVFACLKYNILIQAEHIAGVYNDLADCLSRQQVQVFLKKCPQAAKEPVQIPMLPETLT